MSAIHATPTPDELELVDSILARMSADLSMIVDRDLLIEGARVELRTQRPAGSAQVHISFKLGIEVEGESRQGCLLLPLPEAITLAAFMMMMPDEGVVQERQRTELDGPFKEALLEVGKFLAGACDSVLRGVLSEGSATRSEGCQGVRADVRPALVYREGDPLLVARARARVHEFEPFELILMLPSLKRAPAMEAISA